MKHHRQIATFDRCVNRAMTPENDIRYIVGSGEVRWDCKVSNGTSERLNKYGLKFQAYFVQCPKLSDGDCRAGYVLKNMNDPVRRLISSSSYTIEL